MSSFVYKFFLAFLLVQAVSVYKIEWIIHSFFLSFIHVLGPAVKLHEWKMIMEVGENESTKKGFLDSDDLMRHSLSSTCVQTWFDSAVQWASAKFPGPAIVVFLMVTLHWLAGSEVLDARNFDEPDPWVLRSHPQRPSRHPGTLKAFRQASHFDGKYFKGVGRGPHSSICASHLAASGSILGVAKNFSLGVASRFIDSIHCLNNGQCKV